MAENDPNTLLLLGEIRGQLRELIHNSNNNSQKLDALAIRVTALESDKNRREGAQGVFHTLLKSPALGWLIGGATMIWAFLTGRLQP